MSSGATAFLWGIGSAISLPLGCLIGIWWKPKQKINSAFMAFGAGALLFALTIELFGHVPHHVKEHGMYALFATIAGALLGGLLFDGLNHILNNKGAYLRKLSSAKEYLIRIRLRNQKNLIDKLAQINVLSDLPPSIMGRLVSRIRPAVFKQGEMIFSQGDASNCMYFIISGEVEVIHHGANEDRKIAVLGPDDTFGELGVISDQGRSAEVVAKTYVSLYRIMKEDFDDLIKESPELKEKLDSLARNRIQDLTTKSSNEVSSDWANVCYKQLEDYQPKIGMDDVAKETSGHAAAGGAAMAIWLGLLIDSIPESLVIGMLQTSATGMSLAFVAGVFLANLPEAMSSSVTMQRSGMSIKKMMVMWGSICLVTGVGAYIGAVAFPPNPTGGMYYFVLGIEGLAAGAMLTMIAETMLPEAFEQGGAIVGLSTLLGFLAALIVKVS